MESVVADVLDDVIVALAVTVLPLTLPATFSTIALNSTRMKFAVAEWSLLVSVPRLNFTCPGVLVSILVPWLGIVPVAAVLVGSIWPPASDTCNALLLAVGSMVDDLRSPPGLTRATVTELSDTNCKPLGNATSSTLLLFWPSGT